ncbi:MAG TPA: hypothetical protein O0X66_04745, partial [Methanocorpusculum sp.]|nr:hypothetical protein [Methanocorpusculum sp.]
PESDLLFLTFAIQLRCLAHPSSGAFGQILSAPSASCEDKYYNLPIIILFYLKSNIFSTMSRWGGDRICPNDPDEG